MKSTTIGFMIAAFVAVFAIFSFDGSYSKQRSESPPGIVLMQDVTANHTIVQVSQIQSPISFIHENGFIETGALESGRQVVAPVALLSKRSGDKTFYKYHRMSAFPRKNGMSFNLLS